MSNNNDINDKSDNNDIGSEAQPGHGNASTRPLGFWLRAVDRLLTREFAAALDSEGVGRREWMILNLIDGTVEAPQLAERIRRSKKVRSLVERGWVEDVDGEWRLTDDGRAAKARLTEVVDGLRSRVTAAVGPEAFATTLASLETIARELGFDDERMPFGPRGRHGHPRGGFGPGRGFRPGFGRGFGPHRPDDATGEPHFDEEGFGPRGFGPRGFGRHGFDPRGFRPRGFGPHAWGPDAGRECDPDRRPHESGHGGNAGDRGAREHRHGGPRHTEHAYERGFDAGYRRGRDERSV